MVNTIKNKLVNIILLIACIFYRVIAGKANKKIVPNKILIIQLAKLGDMVCTTPMFRAVKEKFPNCELIVMGDAVNREILRFNQDVDEYIIIGKASFWQNLKKIKEIKPDLACITSPSFLSLAALYLASVPVISVPKIENGWSPYETKAYKVLRNFVIAVPHKMGSYAPREYLKLLEPIGIHSSDTKKHLGFSEEADNKITEYLLKNGINKNDFIVGFSPSAGNKIKKWPEERFAKVADYIYKKYGAKIIIIGGKNDEAEVTDTVSLIDKNTKFFNTCGIFNIDELKALISKMNMFISVDTGPIYIAEAFNVSTVDITGPIDENEQPPIGKFHKVVNIKNRIKPELYVMNARSYNYKEARRQIEEITVEMVITEIDSLYDSLKKNENRN